MLRVKRFDEVQRVVPRGPGGQAVREVPRTLDAIATMPPEVIRNPLTNP
jgi:hypothetical protein